MKTTEEHLEKGSGLGWLAGVAAVMAAAQVLSGCIYVGPVQQTPPNYPPRIVDTELLVWCDYDYRYYDYYWDFIALVDDSNGYADVSEVYVEVWDPYYDPNYPLETWSLANDGGGWWSNRIYEYYSTALYCQDMIYYEFDFYAFDYYGGMDSVTYKP